MPEKPYLSYYGDRGIIPVRQKIDLPLHIARRRGLYRQLGILPFAFRNRNVVEFGPGSGDNAIYVAACSPACYLLVDGNPPSIQAIAEKLEQGILPRDRVEYLQTDILNYASDMRFDVALCEGAVPCQENSAAFLSHIASFVVADGVLAITTMSPASLLAESCRRVLKPFFSTRFPDDGRLLNELVAFFEPDLKSLPGMSRLHEDWVLDMILQPWPARPAFTISEAISTLDREFEVLGTSPSFIQDWRWYKSIPLDTKTWNDVAREETKRWAGYFLDYRMNPTTGGQPEFGPLESACQSALAIEGRIWYNDAIDFIPEFLECLAGIRDMVTRVMPETAKAITDYETGVMALLKGDMKPDFGTFRSWFGRGQQYVSFVRKPA